MPNIDRVARAVNEIEHPDLDVLAGYVKAPDSQEYGGVREHLWRCYECRKSVFELEKLVAGLKSNFDIGTIPVDGDHLSDRAVECYVNGQLSGAEAECVKSHIEQCGDCMKSVLHYRAGVATAVGSEHKKRDDGFHQHNVVNLFKKPFAGLKGRNAWLTSSAVAACLMVALAIPVGSLMLADRGQDFMAVNYGQQSYVTMVSEEEVIPGIAFFSTATQAETRIPHKGLEVNVNDHRHIGLAWAPIPNVERYSIKLYVVSEGQRSIIVERELTGTEYLVNNHQVVTNKRYEWELVGYSQQASYHTRGGFVIDQLPH